MIESIKCWLGKWLFPKSLGKSQTVGILWILSFTFGSIAIIMCIIFALSVKGADLPVKIIANSPEIFVTIYFMPIFLFMFILLKIIFDVGEILINRFSKVKFHRKR